MCLCHVSGPAEASAAPANNFIKSSCSVTTYPALCVDSLSVYAERIKQSPQQLATTALEVSLNRTKLAQTFLKRLTKLKGLTVKQLAAIRDCLEEVEDSVERVSKAWAEMKGMGRAKGEEFTW
ncbi:plant invertase/pectin methylesterase inhibitor family protein, partial [Vibrio campbellii]|uniref:plant invertase/pectin methylesterase inhibitor family protein n=1 Tax=Vibrio campbellii TaxID=680 RepID=UPI0009C5E587